MNQLIYLKDILVLLFKPLFLLRKGCKQMIYKSQKSVCPSFYWMLLTESLKNLVYFLFFFNQNKNPVKMTNICASIMFAAACCKLKCYVFYLFLKVFLYYVSILLLVWIIFIIWTFCYFVFYYKHVRANEQRHFSYSILCCDT